MAAGYTEVKYNDIVLRDCLTKQFQQVPVFTPEKQALLYHKFTVTVQGWFVSDNDYMDQAVSRGSEIERVPRSPHDTAGSRYHWLHNRLVAHRQSFQMTVGVGGPAPQVILLADPINLDVGVFTSGQSIFEHVDRAGGPKVTDLSILEIVANETFKVTVTFEICVRPHECGEVSTDARLNAQRAYGVLSNRWTCNDLIDENRYTKRTYQGELTLSSPVINPHEFRYLCLPPLNEGFMRKRMDFAAQADGLKLRYSVHDEEVTVTPIGMGDESSDGTYMHVTSQDTVAADNTQVTTNLDIRLRGGPRANRNQLLRQAMVYADAKLDLYSQVKPLDAEDKTRTVIVEYFRIREEYDTSQLNVVDLSIQIQRIPNDDAGGVGGMLKNVAQNFGNEVSGDMLAKATGDPLLKHFLKDYNQYQSWGNRTWDTSVNSSESPQAVGSSQIAAALAVYLQGECSLNFSLCAGLGVNDTRIDKIKESKAQFPCGSGSRVSYTTVYRTPNLTSDLISDDQKSNAYENYRVHSEYRENEVVAPMPIARPVDNYQYSTGTPPQNSISLGNAQTAFIRLAPPQNMRIVRVEATRWGAAPKLPPPYTQFTDSDGVQHALINKHVMVQAPELNGNGDSRAQTIIAEYVYALSHTPKRYLSGIPETESTLVDGILAFIVPIVELFLGRSMEYTNPDD